jgi:hypothetical protein
MQSRRQTCHDHRNKVQSELTAVNDLLGVAERMVSNIQLDRWPASHYHLYSINAAFNLDITRRLTFSTPISCT